MKEFTGWEYLLIDVANNSPLDLDKKTFEERLVWVNKNLNQLEHIFGSDEWKEKPLYIKAVQAVRRAQAGEPIGHLVGLDAVCSGLQIMSALTGCVDGATATGLVDPDKRADAYTDCTDLMSDELGRDYSNDRKKVKNGVMTSFYGSKEEPKKEFGDGTEELDAFYKATYRLAPGPVQLLQDLIGSWQPYALEHGWQMPDGFDVKIKVMQRQERRIEVDEIGHSTFTYVWYENQGLKSAVKNAANIIHSVDAYLLRSLLRRCNYDDELVEYATNICQLELMSRKLGHPKSISTCPEEISYYLDQYNRSGIADIVILPYLDDYSIGFLDEEHILGLMKVMLQMTAHKPFEVITVHDDFRAHPNNLNHLRKHYREILAELADSELLSDILSQIHGVQGTFAKLTPDLSKYIRQSNYAIC